MNMRIITGFFIGFTAVGQSFGADYTQKRIVKQRESYKDVDIYFYEAVVQGKLDAADIFLKAGADTNVENGYGWPLIASDLDLTKTAYLLSRGANPDAQNSRGCIALHQAAKDAWVESAALLLRYNANTTIHEYRQGHTPLHSLAVHSADYYDDRKEEIVTFARLLLEHGAAVNARDRDGFTPLHLLCEGVTLFEGSDHNKKNPLALVQFLLTHFPIRKASGEIVYPKKGKR